MRDDIAIIRFFSRWMLAIIFTMAGFWKVFELTTSVHAKNFFVAGYQDTWIPQWLLLMLGHFIPYWELTAGVLLGIGYKSREVLISLAFLLLLTTYGHALKEPLFDIDGFTFTRLILIFIAIAIASSKDYFTLDQLLQKRGQAKNLERG